MSVVFIFNYGSCVLSLCRDGLMTAILLAGPLNNDKFFPVSIRDPKAFIPCFKPFAVNPVRVSRLQFCLGSVCVWC